MVAMTRISLLPIFPLVCSAGWLFGGSNDGGGQVESAPPRRMVPRVVISGGGGLPGGMPGGLPPFMQQIIQGGGTVHGGALPPFMLGGGGGPPSFGGGGGGPRVLVMQGSFGFDPWEDLHRNMERVMHQSMSEDDKAPGGGRGLVARSGRDSAPLGPKLMNLMDVFGDQHQGHVGRADGQFEVDSDDTHFRVSATLPGYKLSGSEGGGFQSPLTVRLVGHRSLVVSGTQQAGPFMKTWQRTFALPRGSDVDKTEITYNASSGLLSVDVPHREGAEAEGDDEIEDGGDDEFMPPALRAMRSGLPELLAALAQGGPPRGGGGGFLIPMRRGGSLADLLPMLDGMHPRNQAPFGQERPVPEEANVIRVGCFAESQLAKAELKYYGEGNGASYNSMYWHARGDSVPYFAMARHDEPLGHAFTFRSFEHEVEKARWGVYDGCGTPCADDEAHDCGCANEAERGFPNTQCAQESEKHFAVYRIEADGEKDEAAAETASEKMARQLGIEVEADKKDSDSAAEAISPDSPGASEEVSQPYWKLSSRADEDEGEPSIEVVVPQGSRVEAKGNEVHFFDDDGADSSSKKGADASSGKVKLPIGVSPKDCEMDDDKSDTGGQVLRCKLEKKDVKRMKIKVVGDEL